MIGGEEVWCRRANCEYLLFSALEMRNLRTCLFTIYLFMSGISMLPICLIMHKWFLLLFGQKRVVVQFITLFGFNCGLSCSPDKPSDAPMFSIQ